MQYAAPSIADERFACREAPLTPQPPRIVRPARAAARVERTLLQADALALTLRAALHRIAVPLSRAAAGFVRLEAWTDFGFASLDDHARERFGRSGRTIRDVAALGTALASLCDAARATLLAALAGDDGRVPLGRGAAIQIARAALRVGPADAARFLPEWIFLGRSLPVRELPAALNRPLAASPAPPPDDFGDRSLLRIPAPPAVLAAFDEALDLFRAVEGSDATVTAFVEALVAESAAAGDAADRHATDAPPGEPRSAFAGRGRDIDRIALRRGRDIARVEAALARSTSDWRRLALKSPASWPLVLVGSSLSRFASLSRAAGSGGPAELDAQIQALLALENDLEARLGRLLAEMAERGAWRRLQFAGVGHYAERRLGVSRTTAEDRARAARVLRRFPLLRAAYEEGRVGLESALLVARLLGDLPVDRRIESAWVGRAEESTVKRLRDEARALGRRRIVPTGWPHRAEPERPLDDGAWHASIRRAPGTARERILLFGRIAAGLAPEADTHGLLPPAPDVFLRLRLPDDLASDFVAAIESRRHALTRQVSKIPWDEPWPDAGAGATPSTLAARAFFVASRRAPPWVGLLALIEGFTDTWDVADPRRRRGADAVFIRDGWRCMAPGCTSRRNLDEHHVIYRSRRGSGELANLLCVCRFHHQRGEHGGLATCSGGAPLDVHWRLGRPALGVWYLNERRLAHPAGSP